MSGDVPPFPFCAYMARTETSISFTFVTNIFASTRSNGENNLDEAGYIENFIKNPAEKRVSWKTKT
jgi:hypothetical protein